MTTIFPKFASFFLFFAISVFLRSGIIAKALYTVTGKSIVTNFQIAITFDLDNADPYTIAILVQLSFCMWF